MDFIQDKIKVICDELRGKIKKQVYAVNDLRYCETDYKTSNALPSPETLSPFNVSQIIEGRDGHYWFYAKLPAVPAQEGKRLCFTFKTGYEGEPNAQRPQGLVYLNGKMTQGLDTNHTEVTLEFDRENEIYIYFYTGSHATRSTISVSVDTVDVKIEKIFYDIFVPYEALSHLDENSDDFICSKKTLELAVNLLDMRVPLSADFYASVEKTEKFLDENFYGKLCGGSLPTVNCIGHTHIDVAWLWTVRQTVEKAQRSFATVLALMKEYPEYKFVSSQPQLYAFVKDQAPELYAEIKERIKEGRWEPEGATWLECDCNLTSGESLVRQILFGKRFMRDEFGVDNKCVWLPDTFGYSVAMPQIFKKCGVKYFVTSKIGWNESNTVPYDSFLWQGLDGSEVFTSFITTRGDSEGRASTYNGTTDPNHVIGTWKRYQQKEYNTETIIPFGHGDGGGGPTREMLEYQRRSAFGLPGLPKTKISFVDEYLEKAEKNFRKNTKLLGRTPRWVGELYLEYHRGTYTSIAKNKKNNRKSEQMMQSLEKISSINKVLFGEKYDSDSINRMWHTVLLDQFHDILPGSSIFDVYEQTDKDYAALFAEGNKAFSEKLSSLAANVKTSGGMLVYNPCGFECSDVIDIDDKKVFVSGINPCGYTVVTPKAPKKRVKASKNKLENDFFKITFDKNFNIASLYDKRAGREVVKSGEKYNQLQIFEDFPRAFDAWEISDYYKQKMWEINDVESTEITDEGARLGIRITRKYFSSTITQTIYLYDDIARIDVENDIDWKEEHQLLKAAFPTDVHANEATYEVQFGHVRRPTHENTSWDKAKFEVCAQKWADISDDGYGVSIINDCKYGHSAEGSTLKLSLLKCATMPNPKADKERHTFRYSIIPHEGSFKTAGTIRAAQLFNSPLTAIPVSRHDGTLPESYSLISCNRENIMIDTVKKAEDDDALIIRAYESFDRRTNATFTVGFDAKKAYICDMLENEEKEIPVVDGKFTVEMSNFEIVTVKLK